MPHLSLSTLQVESLTIMITVLNYKKCRAMKKFITSILIAAAALTACSKSEPITPNIENNKVTLQATINAPQSRSVLVENSGKYTAEWVAGDYIELYEITITGGTKKKANNVNTTLAEGGTSATVSFELAAKTADSFAYILSHNNASINGAATYLAFTVPTNQAPTAMNTYDPLSDLILSKGVSTATQPTETLNFEMERVTALAKISVKGLALAAGDAVKSINFACEQVITGKKTNMLTEHIIAGNDPLTEVNDSSPVANNVVITLPEPQTGDFSCYASLWPATLATGTKCTLSVITNNDGLYTKEITLPKDMVFTSGDITAFTVNMAGVPNSNATPEQPEVRPDYITVAGIKWAAGNLEYEKDGATDTGFAAGWRLTESQYSYIYMDQTGDLKTLTDYSKSNYFNYGGIADPFSCAKSSAISMAASDPLFDYSGKMYTDQVCTIPTTDFAAAQFGDIAYWASNGKYRTPTAAEFQKLYDEACRVKATYSTGVVTINGTYYYNPGEGESAGALDGVKSLTADDLKVGIFLVHAGRGYDGTEYNIYKIGSQGVYRTATLNAASTAEATNGVIYRVQSLTEGAYYHTAYGATARYLIRPVFAE